MANETGVIYWKLTNLYEGDKISSSGLCGTDLDSNFHFLRGADIESVSYEPNNVIAIKRLNGDVIRFKPSLNGNYQMTLNDGVLKIINNGNSEDYLYVEGIGDVVRSEFEEAINTITANIAAISSATESNRVYADDESIEVKYKSDGTYISAMDYVQDVDRARKAYVDGLIGGVNERMNDIETEVRRDKVSAGDDSIRVVENASGTTISVKLSDDDGNIIRIDTNDGLIADFSTLSIVPASTSSSDEYRFAWKLVDGNGHQLGDTIYIYKDSQFKAAYLGHVGGSVTPEGVYTDGASAIRALQFIYTDSEGAYHLSELSLDDFITDDEIGDGLNVEHFRSGSKKVSVAIDEDSENYISVSNAGVKISGIDAAISSIETNVDDAIQDLSATTHAEIAQEASDRAEADEALNTSLHNEIVEESEARANAIEEAKNELNAAIEAEASARTEADEALNTALHNEIVAEKEAREGAINDLSATTHAEIMEEAEERSAAIQNLSATTHDEIAQEASDRAEAIGNLSATTHAEIASEAAARESAIESLSATTHAEIIAASGNLSTEISESIGELSATTHNEITAATKDFITRSVDDLINYYLKSDTYTKDEVQQIISTIKQFRYVLADELPEPSPETMGIIYLIPSEHQIEHNIKDEFLTIEDGSDYKWEQIGSTVIDLSGYVTEEELNTILSDYVTSSALTTVLASYALKTDLPVNVSELNNDAHYITSAATVADSLKLGGYDASAYAFDSDIPTKVSELENDKDYVVESAMTEELATKLDNSAFNDYSASTDSKINSKLNTSDFDAYSASTNTKIDTKLDATAITEYWTSAQTNTAIESAINALDVSDEAEENKMVTSVSESNGKISVTRDYIQVNCGSYNDDPGDN